jgi:hypothetical protein
LNGSLRTFPNDFCGNTLLKFNLNKPLIVSSNV